MDREVFNDKISIWLVDAEQFLSRNNIQEDIFDLPIKAETGEELNDDEYFLLKNMSEKFLKLSFIIKSHKKELAKLIQYLE